MPSHCRISLAPQVDSKNHITAVFLYRKKELADIEVTKYPKPSAVVTKNQYTNIDAVQAKFIDGTIPLSTSDDLSKYWVDSMHINPPTTPSEILQTLQHDIIFLQVDNLKNKALQAELKAECAKEKDSFVQGQILSLMLKAHDIIQWQRFTKLSLNKLGIFSFEQARNSDGLSAHTRDVISKMFANNPPAFDHIGSILHMEKGAIGDVQTPLAHPIITKIQAFQFLQQILPNHEDLISNQDLINDMLDMKVMKLCGRRWEEISLFVPTPPGTCLESE